MALRERPSYAKVCGPIRELLHADSTEDFSIILWSPPKEPPELGSYILMKVLGTDGRSVYCEHGAYENCQFLNYFYGGDWKVIDRRMVLGWSYYPFDNRAF